MLLPSQNTKPKTLGTLNLEPVEEKPLQEEPILLTTPKRKKLKPNLEIIDATIGQTMLPSASDSLAIHTLTGNLEQGNVFASFSSFEQEVVAGRYRLEEKIGEGGMGVVYKGVCLEDNSLVAVKMLRRDMERSEQATERFFREYKAIKAIVSPHVVEVYEYGEEAGGHKYLVMEYLKGEGLDTIIKANGPVSSKGNELHPANWKSFGGGAWCRNYSS